MEREQSDPLTARGASLALELAFRSDSDAKQAHQLVGKISKKVLAHVEKKVWKVRGHTADLMFAIYVREGIPKGQSRPNNLMGMQL